MDSIWTGVILGVLLLVFVALTVIPQRRANAERDKKMTELAIGDRIITVGGVYARVLEVGQTELLIAVEPDDLRMRISPRAVSVFPEEIRRSEQAAKGKG